MSAVVLSTTVQGDPVVQGVQLGLLELGYVMGGPANGVMGPKTVDAILSFRHRNNLPLTPTIDGQLISALETAEKIELPSEQVTATVIEIAPKVEAVQKTWWAKAYAWILGIPSFIATVVLGIIQNLGDAIETLTPLKTFLSSYIASIDPLKAIVIGTTVTTIASFLIWWNTYGAQKDMVSGYNKGTVKNDNKEEVARDERIGLVS